MVSDVAGEQNDTNNLFIFPAIELQNKNGK